MPILGALLGLALFAVIVAFNIEDVIDAGSTLRRAPLGIAISAGVHIPQIVSTALAWRTLLPAGLRPSLQTMVVLRWVRESLNALLPAGAIVGQAVAARRLVRNGITADLAAATAMVDMTVEAAMQGVLTLLGVLLIFALHPDLHLAWLAMIGAILVVALATVAVVVQRNLPVRFFEASWASAFGRWRALSSGWAAGLQESVLRLHADRRSLAQAAACHLTAWLLGAVEITANAALLGHPISIGDGLIVESLTQALRSAAFIVPGALGVQEGAIILSCGLVGVPPDTALALALLRRARELAIGVPGLLAWRSLYRSKPVLDGVSRPGGSTGPACADDR